MLLLPYSSHCLTELHVKRLAEEKTRAEALFLPYDALGSSSPLLQSPGSALPSLFLPKAGASFEACSIFDLILSLPQALLVGTDVL